MQIRFRHFCRIMLCLLLVLVFTFPLGSAVPASPVIPPVAAAGLVELLTKAMPVVQQVVSSIFKGTTSTPKPPVSTNIENLRTQTDQGMKDLQAYMNQEQLLATTVTSAGHALYQVAIMNQIVKGRTKLGGADITHFQTAWNSVSATLDVVAKSGIDAQVMSDSYEKIVITKIIDADGDIKTDINGFLAKYKPNGVDETSVAQLEVAQTVVAELSKRFQDLSDVTGVALKTVAEALSAVVKAAVDKQPPSSAVTTKPGKKPKVNSGAESLFKTPGGYDSLEQLSNHSLAAIDKSLHRDYVAPNKGVA